MVYESFGMDRSMGSHGKVQFGTPAPGPPKRDVCANFRAKLLHKLQLYESTSWYGTEQGDFAHMRGDFWVSPAVENTLTFPTWSGRIVAQRKWGQPKM